MSKLLISFFALVFIFAFNINAFADEGHSHDSNIKQATEKFRNGSISNSEVENDSQDHSDHTESNNDSSASSTHTEIEHNEGTPEEDSHGTTDVHSGQDVSGNEVESGGHHGPVVETPPNYKVLGTFGAVNLSFILIGIWNKWFRWKENK